MKITFLGSGTSMGVPVVGCDCSVCRFECPKNKRTRSSIYVQTERSQFVIDTTPDFRHQMLRENIGSLDFILFTHAHADHIMGLDDVRPLTVYREGALDAYGKPETLKEIRSRFAYLFTETANESWKPEVQLHELTEAGEIDGNPVIPLEVDHGNLPIHGYRIHDTAYVSDVSHIPERTMGKLEGLDLLVLDALRHSTHPTHFSLEEAREVARTIGADETVFTHLSHEIEHCRDNRKLPDNMQLAYDGLQLCP